MSKSTIKLIVDRSQSNLEVKVLTFYFCPGTRLYPGHWAETSQIIRNLLTSSCWS